MELSFSESGLSEFAKMAELAQVEGGEVALSFAKAAANLARLGGRVSRDGELSLYVVSNFHYGVVWFADDRAWSVHS